MDERKNPIILNPDKLLIKGAQVYAGGRLQKADILVSGGLIEAVREGITEEGAAVLDAAGLLCTHAFLDLHVHLREPGFAYKETIETGADAALRGGFTTICPMPNLNPVPDSVEHLTPQLAGIEKQKGRIRVLPFAAITVGEKGERLSDIESLAKICVGFSDDGKGVQDDAMMREAMRRIRAAGSFISAHCEDESLLKPGGCVHEGAVSRRFNVTGISSASESAQVKRDIGLVRETGCRYHVCHVSTKESIELIRQAKKEGLPVTCEVTPHHAVLCEVDITEDSGRFKMNPPLRGEDDREALIQGLLDGTVDAIATDHAPHSEEEKAKGLAHSAFGTVGSETAFAVLYTCLVKTGRMELGRLLHLLTEGPARVIKREAEIAPNRPAELTLIDLNERYVIDPARFLSKGKSTPFLGMEVFGVVKKVLLGTRTVFEEGAAT